MANQYTQAADRGIGPDDPEWPKQSETRREHPEDVRASMRASHAVRKLEAILDDPKSETASIISAAKTISSLSPTNSATRGKAPLVMER